MCALFYFFGFRYLDVSDVPVFSLARYFDAVAPSVAQCRFVGRKVEEKRVGFFRPSVCEGCFAHRFVSRVCGGVCFNTRIFVYWTPQYKRKRKRFQFYFSPRKAWSRSRPTKDCKTIGRSGSAHTRKYSFAYVGVCQSRTWSLVAIRLATAGEPLGRSPRNRLRCRLKIHPAVSRPRCKPTIGLPILRRR